VLLGLPGALLLLVLVTPEVHDPADRRDGCCRYFHQVQPLLPCDRQSLLRRHDAQLLPGVVDDPHLADPDAFVHPRAIVTPRASVECDNYLLQVRTGPARPDVFFRPRRSALPEAPSSAELP